MEFPMNKPLYAALLLAATASQAAQAATLEIEVEGLSSREGQLLVAVYDSAEGWMKKPVRGLRQSAAGDGPVRLRIDNLPEGQYAITLLHDANGNGRMDSNVMGMPTEPYGFSNNAAGSFGPPKFEAARFQLGAEVLVQRIKLN
jgi:uncharacterized protein (DUF2141 family)